MRTHTRDLTTTDSTGIVVARKPDVALDDPSHVRGVGEGNWPNRRYRKRVDRGSEATVTGEARRSTGIASSVHGTIDPRMPKLTPP